MIKKKLTICTLLSFLAIQISCKSSTNSNVNEDKSTLDIDKEQVDKTAIDSKTKNNSTTEIQTQIDLKASEFLKNLKNGEKLSSFFNDNWIFIYHEDNRCDGSTDGQIDNLERSQIDSIITLTVKNDGDGWACDKKNPSTYILEFLLSVQLENWDNYGTKRAANEDNVIYLENIDNSVYLKLHFDSNNLISKFEFRNEDPG